MSMRTLSVATSVVVLSASMYALGQNAAQTPNPDTYYRLGPDSLEQEGVPKGEIRGPFTLPSAVFPGTQHTYWVYVPAQYTPAEPASLMIFNDGQAFKAPEGNLRAHNVLDNLIHRREIPVMLAVFINPGRRPDQPEPTPQNWGDRDTNRPTEYNSLDDRYPRVDRRRASARALQGLQHLEGSGSPRHRRRELGRHRGVHRCLGTPEQLPKSAEHRGELHEHSRRTRLSGAGARRPRRSRSACSFRMAGTTIARCRTMAPTTRPATGSIRTSG